MAGRRRAAARATARREAQDEEGRAREICLRLLTVRQRTRAELRQALLRKGVSEDVAGHVIERLGDVGLVDDVEFAESWVSSRHTNSGLARRALAAELRARGVDHSVAAEAVATVDGESEELRARELVRKKLRAMPDPARGGARTDDSGDYRAGDLAKVRKLVGVLARKGYPQSIAYRVVREELADMGVDGEILDALLEE